MDSGSIHRVSCLTQVFQDEQALEMFSSFPAPAWPKCYSDDRLFEAKRKVYSRSLFLPLPLLSGGEGGSRRDVSAVASESPAWSWPAGCVGAGAQQPSAPGSFLDHHVPQFHRMHPRPALGQQRQNLPPLNDNGRKQGLTWHCRSQGRQSHAVSRRGGQDLWAVPACLEPGDVPVAFSLRAPQHPAGGPEMIPAHQGLSLTQVLWSPPQSISVHTALWAGTVSNPCQAQTPPASH